MKTGIKPLDCEAAREMMFDYIDGQLAGSDSKRLLSHISECEECKRELSERREMLALIRSTKESAPEALFSGVMEKIADIPQEKPNMLARFRFAYGAALVAACAVLTVFVVGRGYFLGGGDSLTSDISGRTDGYAVPARGITEAEADSVMFDEVAQEEILYSADAEIEIYKATTAAVTAATPEVMADYAIIGGADSSKIVYVEAANKSHLTGSVSSELYDKFDLLYNKISESTSGAAVIICSKGDISDLSASFSEELNISYLSFTRYVIETDAAQSFTEYLELLNKKGAPYRAAIPSDGHILTCEIFVLRGEE